MLSLQAHFRSFFILGRLSVSQTTTPDYKRQDTDKLGLPFPTLDHWFNDQI